MGAFEIFHKYMGTGLLVIFYLAAVIYLFFREKQKSRRILFVYLPALILLIYFNPIFYMAFERFLQGEIYFRILWLLPMTVTLAYSAVMLLSQQEGKKRILLGCILAFLTLISGKLVYSNPLFSKAENLHHVPWEVVEICDRIRLEGREVKAAFPTEFLLYVRQYDATVWMPYGREELQGYYDEFYTLMLQEEIDVGKMAELSKEESCHYVISPEVKKLIGNPEEYDFVLFFKVGEYLIFRDNTMDFRLSAY